MDPADINHLMARLAEGDRAAFPGVFRELWPRVRALCLSLLKNPADAEDAAQQAMEKVLRRAAEYDPARPAVAWSLAIAAWECRTLSRWRQRRREIPEDDLGDGAALLDTRASSEERFIREELQRAALSALGALSDADRAALVNAYWEEARANAPAARKRRQRAIERLRVAFRRLYGAD